jgi:alpha-ketoglutarate-dependent taurine dioxygenase
MKDLVGLATSNPYEDFEAFFTEARHVSTAMPQRVSEKLAKFAKYGNADGAILLRNLPQDPLLPPTPIKANGQAKINTHMSELWMCSIASFFGEPIGYVQEREGKIFQDVFPTHEHADKLSSRSFSATLGFHTEMVFHPFSPDHLFLYGLRQDRNKDARTLFSSIRKVLLSLPASIKDILLSKSFRLSFSHVHSPYKVHGKPVSEAEGPNISILYGEESDPSIRFEKEMMVAQTPEAQEALEILSELISKNLSEVTIEPGSLLILDNRHCVHARSVFNAQFDGQDRWLRRMHIVRSLEPSACDRKNGSRIINTDLGNSWN